MDFIDKAISKQEQNKQPFLIKKADPRVPQDSDEEEKEPVAIDPRQKALELAGLLLSSTEKKETQYSTGSVVSRDKIKDQSLL